MSKSEILLCLFYRLLAERSVNKAAFCCDMGISERSFYRYLNDIKSFSIETCTGLEIAADGSGNYILKGDAPQ